MKIFVVHLIDYDGGRPGQTLRQWYCPSVEHAFIHMGVEQGRTWTKRQNPRCVGKNVYGTWKTLTMPQVGSLKPRGSTVWSHIDNGGNWCVMFITEKGFM